MTIGAGAAGMGAEKGGRADVDLQRLAQGHAIGAHISERQPTTITNAIACFADADVERVSEKESDTRW